MKRDQKAVEDAVRQAQRLAEAAKIKLGKIQEIIHPPRSELRVADGVADMGWRSRARMTVPVEAGDAASRRGGRDHMGGRVGEKGS